MWTAGSTGGAPNSDLAKTPRDLSSSQHGVCKHTRSRQRAPTLHGNLGLRHLDTSPSRNHHWGPVASLPALEPWAPPAERGPSLESIYRVSLIVDLCEGNKIISFKKFTSQQPVGGPSKRKKNPGALGTCPMCPLVEDTCQVPTVP